MRKIIELVRCNWKELVTAVFCIMMLTWAYIHLGKVAGDVS